MYVQSNTDNWWIIGGFCKVVALAQGGSVTKKATQSASLN